jgi:hypothetical protein
MQGVFIAVNLLSLFPQKLFSGGIKNKYYRKSKNFADFVTVS